jgi:catechol 2,3-dioxygenase-like lactoylglutathione lyase family enzyme
MNAPQISRVILYVKNIPKTAEFYEGFFGMRRLPGATDGWVELASASGGSTIALHQASVAQKSGAAMKIVFGVEDVRGFKEEKEREGLKFGVVHAVEGFEFCNAKDPAGNSISISSRGLKKSTWRP